MVRGIVSFLMLLSIKVFARILFKFQITGLPPAKQVPWRKVKLIVFLNHTSLLEPLFLGFLPTHFLWRLSRHLVAPGADKTLKRPIVGLLYKLLSPNIISISRKRDETWDRFMNRLTENSVVAIAPEGRMKRRSGLDLNGNKMTVRGGVVDVLECVSAGEMAIAYSGGLHHVHAPGEKSYHFFQTLKLHVDILNIEAYKASFKEPVGSEQWRKSVLADFQHRLETKVPQ
jgi:hypothetical protein